MPKFKYYVRDTRGKQSSGVIEAQDDGELRRMLRANELFLTRYKVFGHSERAAAEKTSGSTPLFSRVRTRDIVVLVRQMATFVRSGIPFAEALQTLVDQMDKPPLKVALGEILKGVVEGRTLSSCMRAYPKYFNTFTVAMVEAGETTGMLDEALDISAEQLDRDEDLRSKVKLALFYPKIVVAAAVGVVAAMLILVVPVFKDVYHQFHGELPGTTQALISISDFTLRFWWIIGLAVAGIVYAFRRYRSTPEGARRIDSAILKIPVVGEVLRKVSIARFCQTLSSCVRGGVPILRSLTISAQTAGNTIIREASMRTVPSVREGGGIATELEQSGEFPPMVTRMIGAGETSGNLEHMLAEINRYYETDIKYSIDRMTRLIEPVVTVVVGSIVLFVLLALYMPVFNLGKTVLGNK